MIYLIKFYTQLIIKLGIYFKINELNIMDLIIINLVLKMMSIQNNQENMQLTIQILQL
jgi:hypothetical protein